MKILMVCLGNICRSPMAEGILRAKAADAGLLWQVDSAGTGSWHVGEHPDRRAIATCARNGIDIQNLRARQIQYDDLTAFDLILTMDGDNHFQVTRMARSDDQREKIIPITQFAGMQNADVPDPYFDGRFDAVFTLLDTVCGHIVRNAQLEL